jgi:hypothetical protein
VLFALAFATKKNLLYFLLSKRQIDLPTSPLRQSSTAAPKQDSKMLCDKRSSGTVSPYESLCDCFSMATTYHRLLVICGTSHDALWSLVDRQFGEDWSVVDGIKSPRSSLLTRLLRGGQLFTNTSFLGGFSFLLGVVLSRWWCLFSLTLFLTFSMMSL